MSTPVVDTQVHVWLPEAPDRPWPPGGAERAKTMHRAEPINGPTLLREMRAAGVDRAVLVPPFFEGYRNDHAVACATAAPEAFRVMARVDLRTGDPGPVRELLRDPVVAGVRLVFLPADAGRVDDPGAEWLWAFCRGRGRAGHAAGLQPARRARRPGAAPAGTPAGRRPPRPDRSGHRRGGRTGDRGAGGPRRAGRRLGRGDGAAVLQHRVPPVAGDAPAPAPALRRVRAAAVSWGSDLSRLRGSYAPAG